MDGAYFGGGALDHVVSGGEVYVNLEQLAIMFLTTGINNVQKAQETGSVVNAVLAHALTDISEHMDNLRMELLKREIEASFGLTE